MTRMILASASPRRRELMKLAGFHFAVMPAQGAEVADAENPADLVEQLSFHKAAEIAAKIPEENADYLIVGADTVVAAEGKILGKPKDREDAEKMIRTIAGRTHQVYTGVTLILRMTDGNTVSRIFHECTDVEVWEMTDAEIGAYIDTPEPYDKAGAYGIQGAFAVYVKGIRGDYDNVVGMPIARTYHEIKSLLEENSIKDLL